MRQQEVRVDVKGSDIGWELAHTGASLAIQKGQWTQTAVHVHSAQWFSWPEVCIHLKRMLFAYLDLCQGQHSAGSTWPKGYGKIRLFNSRQKQK